jgi:hypothetical protein
MAVLRTITETVTLSCDLCGRAVEQSEAASLPLHFSMDINADLCIQCLDRPIRDLYEFLKNPPPYSERYKTVKIKAQGPGVAGTGHADATPGPVLQDNVSFFAASPPS